MNLQNNNNQSAALPRRSRRLASIIPAAHWVSIGYSEDDALAYEKLQNDMKKYCDNNGDADIDLSVRRNEFGLLPHHDLMIPHWQKLLKSLKGGKVLRLHALKKLLMKKVILIMSSFSHWPNY